MGLAFRALVLASSAKPGSTAAELAAGLATSGYRTLVDPLLTQVATPPWLLHLLKSVLTKTLYCLENIRICMCSLGLLLYALHLHYQYPELCADWM